MISLRLGVWSTTPPPRTTNRSGGTIRRLSPNPKASAAVARRSTLPRQVPIERVPRWCAVGASSFAVLLALLVIR